MIETDLQIIQMSSKVLNYNIKVLLVNCHFFLYRIRLDELRTIKKIPVDSSFLIQQRIHYSLRLIDFRNEFKDKLSLLKIGFPISVLFIVSKVINGSIF